MGQHPQLDLGIVGRQQHPAAGVVGQQPHGHARADVHSLGVIGFKLLTGELPYDIAGLSLTDAMRRVAETEPDVGHGLAEP